MVILYRVFSHPQCYLPDHTGIRRPHKEEDSGSSDCICRLLPCFRNRNRYRTDAAGNSVWSWSGIWVCTLYDFFQVCASERIQQQYDQFLFMPVCIRGCCTHLETEWTVCCNDCIRSCFSVVSCNGSTELLRSVHALYIRSDRSGKWKSLRSCVGGARCRIPRGGIHIS